MITIVTISSLASTIRLLHLQTIVGRLLGVLTQNFDDRYRKRDRGKERGREGEIEGGRERSREGVEGSREGGREKGEKIMKFSQLTYM